MFLGTKLYIGWSDQAITNLMLNLPKVESNYPLCDVKKRQPLSIKSRSPTSLLYIFLPHCNNATSQVSEFLDDLGIGEVRNRRRSTNYHSEITH